MRVCVLVDAFDHMSGIRTTYESMLRFAPAAGVRLTLIAPAPRGTAIALEERPGARVIRIPARFSVHLPGGSRVRVDWPDWRRIRQAAAETDPDILHTVSPGPLGIYGGWLARRLGVPLVGYFHTDYLSMQTPEVLASVFPSRPVRRVASRVARLVTRLSEQMMYGPCDVVCCEAQKIVDQVRQRQLHPNPVLVPATLRHDLDPTLADPDRFRRLYRMPAGRPAVLFVGRFEPDKNIPLLAEMVRRLPEIAFVAAGQGPLGALLEGLPNVILPGLLGPVDLWSAYAAADVLLMPSWNETFGLVSLEAMSMGLPVVTADTAGSAQEVMRAGAGVTFAPESPDACEAVLRETLHDRDRLAAMRAGALAWAAQNSPLERYRRFVTIAYRPLV